MAVPTCSDISSMFMAIVCEMQCKAEWINASIKMYYICLMKGLKSLHFVKSDVSYLWINKRLPGWLPHHYWRHCRLAFWQQCWSTYVNWIWWCPCFGISFGRYFLICENILKNLRSKEPTHILVRLWRCGCLVTWFCYQLIVKPGNKTAAPSWLDPYV